jgi:cytochrome c oxidase subunit 2
MAITPEQKKHGIILAGSLVAIIVMVWLMKVAFDLPTTTLVEGLPGEQAAPGSPQFFTLADGAAFSGDGKLRIGDESIQYQRVTGEPTQANDPPAGMPMTKGGLVARNPDTFKVTRRGAPDDRYPDGSPISAHPAGSTADPVGTLFFPENNASFGEDVDELFYLVLWITGIAFILTEAFLLFCIISFWDRPGARAHYTHGHHKFELGATLVVVVILVTLALWQNEMWTQMKQIMPVSHTGTEDFETQEKNERAVHYQVIGKRFKWFFRHPGLDGRFGTSDDIATSDMVVVAGRPVLLHMRSQDVLHSFFLPHYRVKQDVVPGMTIPGWFEPLRAEESQIMCAELCGEGHTTMGARLKVLELEAYREWVRTESVYWRDINLGGDPSDPDFDPAGQEARTEWFGDTKKDWWWWDSNDVRLGYAEDYAKKRN